MAEESGPQRWWESVPKILAVITGVITGITGLIVAINQFEPLISKPKLEQPPAISIPQPISPADGIKFSQFPRTVTLVWDAVPAATDYKVEIEFDGGGGRGEPKWVSLGSIKHVNTTTYTTSNILRDISG
jgi:hypothetical protein